MDYFPLFADLHNRDVLVVGGGAVAERKVRLLLKAHAHVTIIAPRLSTTMKSWAEGGQVEWLRRKFDDDDMTPYVLVYAATDDGSVNQRVYTVATAAGKLVNTVDQKDLCTFISPAIVDRSPVIVAISTGGASPVLARRLRSMLEIQLPQRLGRVADFANAMRDTVKSVLHKLTPRRLFWEEMLDGKIYELLLGGYEHEARQRFMSMLGRHQRATVGSSTATGLVALVGAGPGDPGLLTVRALQVMQSADVVLHDKLVGAGVLELCRRDAELVDVGKRSGNHRLQQQEINQMLVDLARQGKRVVRLKGGDPFIFGRGGEELLALADSGIQAEVVPGISAAVACAAAARLPLTHRQLARSVTFVTAHCQTTVNCVDWSALVGNDRTLAIYMGIGQVRTIQDNLIRHGQGGSTPWAIIQNGTTSDQRIIFGRLDALADMVRTERVQAPAMLILGHAAEIPQEIHARHQYHFKVHAALDAARATA
ncbi:MAG: uroporphyrinogen-III C-methyltransferase [Gammaproteobacteria bacterium]|nr:uroporphyrinogen-III C-methyltransferase [Gammaproteobacteria bacterium]